MSDFQPPDTPEPDSDALWEEWFDKQEKGGYAVISREEWNAKLDEAASIGYAEGRADEREEAKPLIEELRKALQRVLNCVPFHHSHKSVHDAAIAAVAKATGDQA